VIIFFPNNRTRENIIIFIVKFISRASPSTFVDSLSDFGRTIASSYLNADRITIIPTRLVYTEKIPKDSGENSRVSTGLSRIDRSCATTDPEIRTDALLMISDLRR
jgi:hypothetical protein